jgi:hypothetical protein
MTTLRLLFVNAFDTVSLLFRNKAAPVKNPTLKAFYQRLRAAGKPAKLALTAVARKLLILLNSALKIPTYLLPPDTVAGLGYARPLALGCCIVFFFVSEP